MLRRFVISSLLVAVVGLFSATHAKADEIYTWNLPASPTIPTSEYDPGNAFEIASVPFWLNGVAQGLGTFDFFNLSDMGGGFALFTGGGVILDGAGFQIYTGPAGSQESAPTFLPGTYALNDGTLSITAGANGTDLFTFTEGAAPVSGVPEPSSLLLIGTGALALIGFARKKVFG